MSKVISLSDGQQITPLNKQIKQTSKSSKICDCDRVLSVMAHNGSRNFIQILYWF